MAYEVRIDSKPVGTFDDTEAALDRVRDEIGRRPDCEPEIIDTSTGRAFEPASSKGWREHLTKTIR
ncbi:MAG TPA: hypothetical protein VLJ20_11470 [Acetobacteraceae bacterium]|nr:hypothetical protein [Acetobacteraceae bacterium]